MTGIDRRPGRGTCCSDATKAGVTGVGMTRIEQGRGGVVRPAVTAFTLAALILSPTAAPAGDSSEGWQLVWDTDPVCRVFEENLRAYPEFASKGDQTLPLAEGLGITKPDWRPLDPRQHEQLLKWHIRYSAWAPESDEEVDRIWKLHRRDIEVGKERLESARIDYDGDGENETLYRWTNESLVRGRWIFFMYDPDKLHESTRVSQASDVIEDVVIFGRKYFFIDDNYSVIRDDHVSVSVYEFLEDAVEIKVRCYFERRKP